MTQLICCACSNGCALSIARQDKDIVIVDGQACARGVGYAFRQLHEREPGKYIPKTTAHYDERYLSPVLRLFGYSLSKILSGILIQGSPDRSMFRTVVQTSDGLRFILEEIEPAEVEKRQCIAKNLGILLSQGLPVISYVGNTVQEYAGKYWQLSSYFSGVSLDRTTYWQDAWRGIAVADFLADLYREAGSLEHTGSVFSLQEYIENLLKTLTTTRPDILQKLQPVIDVLRDKLFPVYDTIPIGFCHGDPHPLNMLWGEKKISAVIDWEFSGLKPRLYDAALIIGCVGVESPEAGTGGFIQAFKLRLQERQVFSEEIFTLLPIFTLALRFAWASEWLRRDDAEMLQFEVQYMQILLQRI